MMKKLTFGEKVRELRKARNWTQAQLAGVAGINSITILKTELGQTEPILAVQKAIAEALGTTVKKLISEDDKEDLGNNGEEIITGPEDDPRKER
jgi:transcriptional regulator with XRE-family HTH domain